MGLRLRDLGTSRFTWGDLHAIIRWRSPGSALSRSIDPDWRWRSLDVQLLALVADASLMTAWLQTGDATKRNPRNRPEPIPRPGVGDKPSDVLALPSDEVARRLALPRVPIDPDAHAQAIETLIQEGGG